MCQRHAAAVVYETSRSRDQQLTCTVMGMFALGRRSPQPPSLHMQQPKPPFNLRTHHLKLPCIQYAPPRASLEVQMHQNKLPFDFNLITPQMVGTYLHSDGDVGPSATVSANRPWRRQQSHRRHARQQRIGIYTGVQLQHRAGYRQFGAVALDTVDECK